MKLRLINRTSPVFTLLFLLSSVAFFQERSLEASQPRPTPFQLKQDDLGPPLSKKDLRGSVEEMLFEKTNQMRAKSKLPALGSNSILVKAAHYH